jgi:hypothetical protein
MKKLALALAAAATIAVAPASSASALTIIKPIGGWHPHHHFGGGLSFGVGVGVDPGFSAGYAPGCFFVRHKVFVPGVGIVKKRQLVCA